MWFRFPKLGFSSPTKKGKEADRETDPNEGTAQDDDDGSPTEKSETYFDAQETLPPQEIISERETETSGDGSSVPVVSSSARTELILLEKEKAGSQNIQGESSK
ncbi:hypothetical protein JRQ81_001186 [Phrynocephalus forsythii]|uniref:Uncharacterized protein n=1 Tax=Phrynocephalus forsythii TaxID=171643 RepID=A0A9Q0Y9E5_9SAUR|nr:hypothetical protein JRQ81_001186 [Phrynocephalus forsythii]